MLVTLYLLCNLPVEKRLYLGLTFTGCSVLEKRIIITFLTYMGRAAILHEFISRYVLLLLLLFKHHLSFILLEILNLKNHMMHEDITVST